MTGQEAQAQQERRQEGERYQRELENRANLQAEAEKRRARVPTDKNIPPGVDELIVGDGVAQYARLRDVERKLDAIMMRKRLDLQDPLRTKVPKFSTLKIWISNTVDNQPWQGREFGEDAFDFSMGPEAVFKVKIEGRVLDEDPEETPAQNDTNGTSQEADDAMDVDGEKNKESSGPDPEQAQPQPKKRPKFSHFFKSITVEFDRNKTLQPENLTQIEWKKPKPPQTPGGLSNAPLPAEADFDCLEFERKSDENINCHVNLFRDEHPERFRLSKDLSQLLDMGEDDRGGVITAIYDYAKAMGLLGEEDKRLIRCDDRLRAVSSSNPSLVPSSRLTLFYHRFSRQMPSATPICRNISNRTCSPSSPSPSPIRSVAMRPSRPAPTQHPQSTFSVCTRPTTQTAPPVGVVQPLLPPELPPPQVREQAETAAAKTRRQQQQQQTHPRPS